MELTDGNQKMVLDFHSVSKMANSMLNFNTNVITKCRVLGTKCSLLVKFTHRWCHLPILVTAPRSLPAYARGESK